MMLQLISDFAKDTLQTGFRLAPWPTEPGLREIGKPGPLSPVLVTCNFDLTVRRVMRALRGNDAWLVVAPSSGINVWCAASGGHLSTHQVVTALKTSGVGDAFSIAGRSCRSWPQPELLHAKSSAARAGK